MGRGGASPNRAIPVRSRRFRPAREPILSVTLIQVKARCRCDASLGAMICESDAAGEEPGQRKPLPSVEETISRARRTIESTEERLEETRRVIGRVQRILDRMEPEDGPPSEDAER